MTSSAGQNRAVFVYDTDDEVGGQRLVSIIDPDTVFATGLCTEAILGVVVAGADGDRLTPDTFRPNPAFVEHLGRLIAEHIVNVEGIRLEAQRQRSGYVYVLDGRTPTPDGEVPPADVIGAVSIDAGEVVAGSYLHNPNHQLLTGNGFFVLPPELEAVLQDDLRARCRQLRPEQQDDLSSP